MKRKFLGAAMVAGFALALSAGAEAKTLVYCSEGSPESFNPQLGTAGTTFDASSIPIYDRLVEIKYGSSDFEPGLAQTWEVSDDGLTYTFHLRKGVKWQATKDFKPTRDFNADDVVFTISRMFDQNNPYYKVSGGTYSYFTDVGMPDLLDKIEKVDDNTVKFHLKAPNATIVSILTLDSFSMLSKEYADQELKAGTPEKVDTNPVGTGPFTLVDYQKDSTIRYKANKTYWRGKPKIDNLVYSITSDAAVRYAKMKAGECQMMAYPNPADIDSMKKDKNLKVEQQQGFNIGYLAFNVEHKPYDDKRVRQAINMAINKKAIMDAIYLGAGVPAINAIPPTLWSYNKSVKDYPYDPDQAKKLLAEAGLGNGFETTLWAMPVQRPYNPNAQRMAELMQADLEKVGIKAKIVSFEWKEYLKRVREGEQDMVLLGWTGDYGDPDNFFGNLLSCDAAKSSSARWCYKPFDDLIVKARQTGDIKERTKLYEQAQVIFKEEAPWFTIAHSVVTELTSNKVVGYKMSPFGSHDFQYADLK